MNSSLVPPKDLKQKLLVRRFRPHLFIIFIFSAIIIILGVGFATLKPYLFLALEHGITPSFAWRLLTQESVPLKQTDQRINILVLGIPGGNHEGKDLTDSMFIISLSSKNPEKSAFISLPRDIWSPTLKDKINGAYHYGEEKRRGGGLILAKSIASEVTGLPLHYAMLIDFSQFTRLVDVIGGVDVVVDKAFDDYDFPIEGRENDLCSGDSEYRCRYKHIHFDAGREHMSGEQALDFVRSRHAEDEAEGTDYARSRRQQAVVIALKEKLSNKRIYLDSEKDRRLLILYDQATDTDLLIPDLLYLAKLLRNQDLKSFSRIAVPAETNIREKEDLLVVGPKWKYTGRWVLVPRTEDFTEIHNYINCKLNSLGCSQHIQK